MNILFCTPSFNHPTNPIASIFFEDQFKTASYEKENNVGVISVNMISLKDKGSLRYIIPSGNTKQIGENICMVFNIISIPKMRLLNLWIQLFIQRLLFQKYIKANCVPDIIHAQQFEGGALALWARKKYQVPYVITEHTTLFARNKASGYEIRMAGNVYSESSYNMAVSHEFAIYLSGKFNVKFHYMPNVVDTDFFMPGRTDGKKFIFVNVAGLEQRKNHKLLIDSFCRAFKGNLHFELFIIGDGPLSGELSNMVEKLQIGGQIKLMGKLARSEIKTILGISSCFVLSSIYETFGIVLIEAMSCGLPVISTKSKGPESIITDGKLGILCESNIDSLSAAMITVTKELYNSEYIRDYVISNFSEPTISRELSKIYKMAASC